MATPWDRAAKGYVDAWMPRFVPYHLDLIRELDLRADQRVLVTCAGPGGEVLAAARAVGEKGHVEATDASDEMIAICRAKVEEASFRNVTCRAADASDASGGPWDAILCAFGLWQIQDRVGMLSAWGRALAEQGKIGIITWGPADEDDPFERVARCLQHLEPDYAVPSPRILAARDSMNQMFEQAGLVMVRHTVVRHTITFAHAEDFFVAMKEGCTWRRVWEDLGEARVAQVAAQFYGLSGGPDVPLSWRPAATLAIAALPGSDIAVASRRGSLRPAAG